MRKSYFEVVFVFLLVLAVSSLFADTNTGTVCDAELSCNFLAGDGNEYYCSLETGTCFKADTPPAQPNTGQTTPPADSTIPTDPLAPVADPRIPALQASVATLQQDIATLDADITALKSDLLSRNSQADALQQQLQALTGTVDGLSRAIKEDFTPQLSDALVAQASLQQDLASTKNNLVQLQKNLQEEQSFTKTLKISFFVLLVVAIGLSSLFFANRRSSGKTVNKEIQNYITKQIQQGKKFPEIKEALLKAGWDEVDITPAYKETIKHNYQEYQRQKARPSSVGYDKNKIVSIAVVSGLLVFGILFILTGTVGRAFFATQTVKDTGEVGISVKCTSPQITTPTGNSCCTDANNNKICDIAERTVEPMKNNRCTDNLQCPTQQCINAQCLSLDSLYKGSPICDKQCNYYSVKIVTNDGESYIVKPGQGSYTAAGALDWTIQEMPSHCNGEKAIIPVLITKKEPGKILGEEFIALRKGQSSKVITHPTLPNIAFTMRVIDVREICE